MTPPQWARVLRAGCNAVVHAPSTDDSPATAIAVALTAMAREADAIGEEIR